MNGDEYFQLPFSSISNFLPYTDRKALTYAFYNALAAICIVGIIFACTAIFLVLQVFLRPLVWALVVGTCLFPCKHILSTNLRNYLKRQKENGYPFCFSIIIAPVQLIQSSAESLLEIVSSKMFPFLLTLFSTGCFLYMQEFGWFVSIGLYISKIYGSLSTAFTRISYILSPRLVIVLALLYYLLLSSHLVRIPRAQSLILSTVLWFLVLVTFSSFFGILQPLIMIGTMIFIFYCYFTQQIDSSRKTSNSNLESSTFRQMNSTTNRASAANMLLRRFSLATEDFGSNNSNLDVSFQSSNCRSAARQSSDSSAFVQGCFMGLGLVQFSVAFWTRAWVMHIALIFSCLSLCILAAARLRLLDGILWLLFRLWEFVKDKLHRQKITGDEDDKAAVATEKLEDTVIVPTPIKISFEKAYRLEQNFYDFADDYLEYFVSMVLIGLMVLATILFTIFIVVQVHGESLHLISLSSSLVNSTVHSGAFSWIPDQIQMESVMRSTVTNVHQFGQGIISSKVDQLFQGSNDSKKTFEKQILEIWKKICMHFLVESNTNDSVIMHQPATKLILLEPGSILSHGRNISLKNFHRNIWCLIYSFEWKAVVNYFRENVGIIMNVADSVWRIVSSHASFLTHLLTATTSLLFAGGSVVLNFTVSFLIFLTTLFYLLAASGSTYLPVDFVVSLTPQPGEASPTILSFYASVEAAIASVLVTTLKKTIFYGMYTVLTHSLFGLDIVVLPSILSTILGAIPLMGTYWAALPGVVELWFVRRSYWLALLLIILHILPYWFMDTALYSEIKGAGHPYLTGLSIAGGLYYFGAEGAFIGPMILCCMLVGVNLYRMFLDEANEPSSGLPLAEGVTTKCRGPNTKASIFKSDLRTSRSSYNLPYSITTSNFQSPRPVSKKMHRLPVNLRSKSVENCF